MARKKLITLTPFRKRWLFIILTLCSVLAVLAGWILWGALHRGNGAPGHDVSVLRRVYPVVVYQGPKAPFYFRMMSSPPPYWVKLDAISEQARWAIVVSEDWAFFHHDGYDPNQIKEVLTKDIPRGKGFRGASTITQQVVKNVFLTQKKTIWRKLNELGMAVELDRVLSKNRILEIYLNIVEWGEGIFGIQKAAEFYFQKAPTELNAKEGAFLAMLLPSPKRYSQSFRDKHLTDYAQKTIHDILKKMVRAKILTEEEYLVERERPLAFEAENQPKIKENEIGEAI